MGEHSSFEREKNQSTKTSWDFDSVLDTFDEIVFCLKVPAVAPSTLVKNIRSKKRHKKNHQYFDLLVVLLLMRRPGSRFNVQVFGAI